MRLIQHGAGVYVLSSGALRLRITRCESGNVILTLLLSEKNAIHAGFENPADAKVHAHYIAHQCRVPDKITMEAANDEC